MSGEGYCVWCPFKSGGQEDLDEKVTFEQRPDGGKGGSHAVISASAKAPGQEFGIS